MWHSMLLIVGVTAVAVAAGALLALGFCWYEARVWVRADAVRGLTVDQAAWQRLWCPYCDVLSLTTDRICPQCHVDLIPLRELETFGLPRATTFKGRDRRRDATVMVDQATEVRRARLVASQQAVAASDPRRT